MAKQKGFTPVMLLLIVSICAAVGFAGWYIVNQNTSDEITDGSSTMENEPSNNDEPTSDTDKPTESTPELVKITNEHFTLMLPTDFVEGESRIFTYTGPPEKTYSYLNETTGEYFEININPAASGYSPDFTWYFTSDSGVINLEKTTTDICDPASDEFCTTAGNGRLDAFISNRAGYDPADGLAYYFTFGNTSSETTIDLSFVDEFIANLTMAD